MNAIAVTYIVVALGVVLLGALFALIFPAEVVSRVRGAAAWLLKASFVDFVKMVIFLKPWKPYAWQTAVIAWLILAYVAGSYVVRTQPKLSDIPGPYIPMIGYIYYLSALYIAALGMFVGAKLAHKD